MTKKNPPESTTFDGFYDGLRRPGIMRSSQDKWFAGVSGGIARRLGVDPLVVRGAFVLLSVFFGVGVSLYLVLWLLMPTERGEISLERALKYGDGGSIFLLVITAMSVFGGGPWFGDGGFQGVRVGGVVVVGVVAWYFLTRTDAGKGLVQSSPWAHHAGEGRGQSGEAGADGGAGGWPSSAAAHDSGVPAGMSQGNAAAAAGAAANGGYPGWVPPAAISDPSATRTHVRTLGLTLTLVVLGAALATGALLNVLGQNFDWPGNHVVTGVAGGLVVVGLSLVLGGVAGRRSGLLNPVAGVAIAFLAISSLVPAGIDSPWTVGDRSETVTTLGASNDYQLGVGQLSVDLTKADFAATAAKGDLVTASVGVGQLDVRIPQNTSVVVNVQGRVGEAAKWTAEAAASDRNTQGTDSAEGFGWSRSYRYGTGAPELVVNAEVGVGEIRVITEAGS